ncbi:MHO_1590 family protein [Mycoplasma sp. Ms02]|uniref:MHO_1590 family protein n=1 Tax=Mycoplasma sp. Ms02 TaxID=353851 RepID=UPI001C8AD8AF|nr:hypothetical protein [Mycoplasma sp. Ms02]QZE12594.1 hypothetical protein K4L35_01240 [Mycoplasma sp. Ms02]
MSNLTLEYDLPPALTFDNQELQNYLDNLQEIDEDVVAYIASEIIKTLPENEGSVLFDYIISNDRRSATISVVWQLSDKNIGKNYQLKVVNEVS